MKARLLLPACPKGNSLPAANDLCAGFTNPLFVTAIAMGENPLSSAQCVVFRQKIKKDGDRAWQLAGTPLDNFYDGRKNRLRMAVNAWIRKTDVFDRIVNADALMRDHGDASTLISDYDSGDHLHPGPAGNKVPADAIAQHTGSCSK